MTKSVKVKIILIISFLTLSALIMTFKYFTEFKQTQIEVQESQENSWDSPINQFEFADPQDTPAQEQQPQGSISKINLNPQAFLQIQYSTQPFVKTPNAKEMAEKIAFYGKDPAIQNFVRDMNKALGKEELDFNSLPSVEEFKKQMTSTQTQKILLQYSKDPAFRKAVKQMMQDPAIMTGFINYINQPEQERSK
ncbi:MAG: hypothetical protein II972_00540 [Elusimicrobiaceae bacterium]|nr:hypothetical protein [Elusimicrobiaceae bacterium]